MMQKMGKGYSIHCILSMSESFIISFMYAGKSYDIESKFVRVGYIHQFHLNVLNVPLIVEYNEERNYRIIDPDGTAGKT